MNQFSILLVFLAVLITSGCSSNPDKRDPFPADRPRGIGTAGDNLNPLAERQREQRLSQIEASQFYWRARQRLENSDYITAIENYDELSTRFPFSEFTTQGELERIYALYRNFDYERALASAERFLREHPRHSSIDYIHYVKGLINFSRDDSALNFLPVDSSKGDVSGHRRAFDEFSLLVQRYPNSDYASDAYQRMVYIRNRLAAHELHVVDYYVRRGAYVAASKRAEQVVARYPETPASYRALHMLVTCYELAGLDQQAADARTLVAAQDPALMAAMRDADISELATIASAGSLTNLNPPESKGFLSKVSALFGSDEDSAPRKVLPVKDSSVPPAQQESKKFKRELSQDERDFAKVIEAAKKTEPELPPQDDIQIQETALPTEDKRAEDEVETKTTRAAANTDSEPTSESAPEDQADIDLDSYRAEFDEDGYQVIYLKKADHLSKEHPSSAPDENDEEFFETEEDGESEENSSEAPVVERETGMKLDTRFRLTPSAQESDAPY